ncbi:hypothetical protein BT96DRAFT_925426, partial [Gymnopus androsaceus JB14]
LYYSNHIPGAIYNLFQVKSLAKFIIIYFIFFRINFGCFIIDPAECETMFCQLTSLVHVTH